MKTYARLRRDLTKDDITLICDVDSFDPSQAYECWQPDWLDAGGLNEGMHGNLLLNINGQMALGNSLDFDFE